jgi:hypothetical protein
MKAMIVLGLVGAVGVVAACGGGQAAGPGAGAPASAPAPAAAPASDSAPLPASASAASSASTTAPASAPAAASAATPAPPPATGGSVLIGDIAGTKKFDPKAAVTGLQQPMLDCYNKARGAKPALHGKLKLRVVVNDTGTAVNVTPDPADELGKDETLVTCLSDALHTAHFPKPGGMATVTVPLLFRP